jgi:hypothetical protein
MKDGIKSKFSKDACSLIIPSNIFAIILILLSIYGNTKNNLVDSVDVTKFIWLSLLSIGLLILCVNTSKIRYYIISQERLKYYSFWHPFGKTLYFSNYTGKIITTETGSIGSYKVVYLVDRNNMTTFKIMGLIYKNFEEMNDAIPLKKISFSPTGGQYFKLLFTGRIKVKKQDRKQKNTDPAQTIRVVTATAAAIGVLLFTISMIVKILSKLM